MRKMLQHCVLLFILICVIPVRGISGGNGKASRAKAKLEKVSPKVIGQIVDSKTGEAIPDVKIEIHVEQLMIRASLSNESGNFSVSAPVEGRFVLHIRKSGYSDKTIPLTPEIASGSDLTIEMEKREIRKLIVIQMHAIIMDSRDSSGNVREIVAPPAVDFTGHLEHSWKTDNEFGEAGKRKKIRIK